MAPEKLIPPTPVSLTGEDAGTGSQQNSDTSRNESPTLRITGLVCPACRRPHNGEYAFCPECGAALREYGTSTASVGVKSEGEFREATESVGGRLGVIVGTRLGPILRMLRNIDQPVRSYVLRAWLISIVPTFLFIGPIALGMALLVDYDPPLPTLDLGFLTFGALFLAPFVESLIMWPILWILMRLLRKTLLAALVSAVIWGVLHGLQNVVQGIVITWAFFVFSLCFLEWKKKSILTGIGVTALLHMCHNMVPVCAVALFVLLGGELPERKATPCPPPRPLPIEQAPHKSETASPRAKVEPGLLLQSCPHVRHSISGAHFVPCLHDPSLFIDQK